MNNYFFEITLDYIDIKEILEKKFHVEYGATVFFLGKVLNFNSNKKVVGINYDMCDELVLLKFYNICKHYCDLYKNIRIYISHFKGYLKIGFISIVIIVESLNRKNSFIICNMILEDIKNNLPIWKYEHYFFDDSNWLNGKTLN